jgi:hypothetical protein
MQAVSLCILAIGVGCAVPALAAFKCTDEKGRTHFEETPPAACANVVTYELSRSGSVIRKIEPAGDAEAKRATSDKAAATDKASGEQKRRDSVLLDSYTSERDIDAARDRNLEMIKNRVSAARASLKKAETREQQAQKLVDAKGRAVPPALAADLAAAKTEHAHAAASAARAEKDLESTQARFAADKSRWLELRATK